MPRVSETRTKASVKIGKFGQKLGFPGLGRDPQRKAFKVLMGELGKLQPNEEAAGMLLVLNQAVATLNGEGEVKTLIEQANRTAGVARDLIERLKRERDEEARRRKAEKPGKQDTKAMEQVRKELTEALGVALGTIDPAIGKYRLPQTMTRNALQAGGETIRREIGAGDPNAVSGEGTRADAIREMIEDLSERIARANEENKKRATYMTTEAVANAQQAEQLLVVFNRSGGGDYKGPLLGLVEKMRMNMSAVPADPDVLRALFSQISKERESARDDVNYVGDSQTAAVEGGNGEALAEEFRTRFEGLGDGLNFLRESEAPGYKALSSALEELRSDAALPCANDLLDQTRQGIEGRLATLEQQIEQQRDQVALDLDEAAKEAQEVLAEAKQRYESQHKVHGEAEVLEADWKSIEALIGSAESILPATGAIPKGISIRDVQLARQLADKANDLLKVITANLGSLLTFEQDMKDLAKQLDERSFWGRLNGEERSMLEKYDPKNRVALDKRLDEIVKGLSVTPAKTSIDAYATLKKDADEAVVALKPTVDYLVKTATPKLQEMEGQRLFWVLGDDGMGSNAEYPPKTFDEAMIALKAQIELQPPVLAALTKAFDDAERELQAAVAMTPEERLQRMQSDDLADKTKKKNDKTERSSQRKLLAVLKDKFDAAAIAVNGVDGDTNALKAAERLIEQIEAEIKADSFDKLETRRKDLEARLDLLLANPLGEVNRRRSELPGVIQELRGAIATASDKLESTAKAIEGHDAKEDEATADAIKDAAALFRKYIDLLGSEVDEMADVAKPITSTRTHDEDARRKAREDGLRLLRGFRNRLRGQPMTSELLQAPFADAKSAVAPVFRALDKYEYTLTTCI